MTKLTKEDVFGPTILPGFNGVGEINLEEFVGKLNIPELEGYEFSHLGSLDLQVDVDESDEKWLNDAIREEGNTDDRIEQLENNYEIKGYLTSYEPGMGTETDPIDGRGRAIAGKRNGEKKIPWLYYKKVSKGEKNRISNGVLQNLKHDPATKGTRADVIKAGVYLIKLGELENNAGSIVYWLKNSLKINTAFNERNMTLIANGIKKQADAGEDVVRVQKRKLWEEWVLKNLNKKIDDKKVFLFSVDNDAYICRCLCQAILESAVHGRSPAEIILYTNKTLPTDAREKLNKFVNELEKYVYSAYTLVERDQDCEYKKKFQTLKPYTILGALPQFIVDHKDEYHGRVLVKLEDY